MAVSYQLVIDCASPEPLAHFWAEALHSRRELVEAEAARLVGLGATRRHSIVEAGLDHYALAMADPEGNEFDTN